jgi:hypothetical protein
MTLQRRSHGLQTWENGIPTYSEIRSLGNATVYSRYTTCAYSTSKNIVLNPVPPNITQNEYELSGDAASNLVGTRPCDGDDTTTFRKRRGHSEKSRGLSGCLLSWCAHWTRFSRGAGLNCCFLWCWYYIAQKGCCSYKQFYYRH